MWLSESDAQIDCLNAQRDSWRTSATKCITSRFDWHGDDVMGELWRHFHCSVYEGSLYIAVVRSAQAHLIEAGWRISMSVYKVVSGSDKGLSPVWCQTILNCTFGNIFYGNVNQNTSIFIPEFAFEHLVYNMVVILSRPPFGHFHVHFLE